MMELGIPRTPVAAPACVARYFRFALSAEQVPIRSACFEQRGFMRASGEDRWSAFAATEHFSGDLPAFSWHARMRIGGIVPLRVDDAYSAGAGTSAASIAGFIPIAHLDSTPQVNAASLVRYLAEAPWIPTALLPSERIVWRAIDERSANVSLLDGDVSAEMHVVFGERGEIESVLALRHRDVRGSPVLTPWLGRFSEYDRLDGMMIPRSAEVSWILDGVATAVWRGRIESAHYEFDRSAQRVSVQASPSVRSSSEDPRV